MEVRAGHATRILFTMITARGGIGGVMKMMKMAHKAPAFEEGRDRARAMGSPGRDRFKSSQTDGDCARQESTLVTTGGLGGMHTQLVNKSATQTHSYSRSHSSTSSV